ncbi:MAG: carbohydrate binding domain-containing protein, partial [Clostridia bacterium]|nr:carbohydrate binding domain-containing protein [Clostridia bacterium]
RISFKGITMKSKKLLIIMLIALIALVALVGCNSNKVDYDTEIVVNGGFENFHVQDSDTVADNWTIAQGTTEYLPRNESQTSEYNSALGKRYLRLNPSSSGFHYVSQKVRLEKNAIYRLSAYMKVDSVSSTAGVFINGAVETVGVVSSVSTSEWTQVSQYFTSTVSGEVELLAAIGTESVNGTGDVSFDNISIQKVESAPDDEEVVILRMKEGYDMADGGSITFVVMFTLISAGILVGMFFMIKSILQNKVGMHPNDGVTGGDKFLNAMTGNTAKFIYVLLVAFVVRFITVLATAEGNAITDAMVNLAKGVADNGILSYYSGYVYDSQGVVWLMGVLGYLGKALNMEDVGYSILVRMPMMIADLTICYMLFSCAAKYQNERMATTYGFIYAILPVFFVFGSLYGSVHVIAMAFLVAMALSMLQKKYVSTGIFYTLALFFSNYALILLPVILLYQIYAIATDKSSIVKNAVTMAGCFVVFYLLSLPLCWSEVAKGDVLCVFSRMYSFFASANSKLSDNAFNLYAIFAAGGKIRPDNLFLDICNWLFVIAMSAYVVYHYIRTANRLDLVLLSGVMLVAYGAIGAQGNIDVLPMGLALILMYLIITPDIRLYIVGGSIATLSFLNMAQLLSRSGFISGVDNAAMLDFEGKNAFLIIFSILTVLATFYLLYVATDVTLASNIKLIEKERDISDGAKEEESVTSDVKPQKTNSKKKAKKAR